MPRLALHRSLLIATLSLSPALGHAANGYFPHGWGARSAALAGAGVALSGDALMAATNPAALAGLQQDQLQLGLSVIRAWPAYTASPFAPPTAPLPPGNKGKAPGRYEADPDVPGDIFPVPMGAAGWRLDARSAIGVAVYANGGLNATYTDFANPLCPSGSAGTGTYCGGRAANDLGQLFVAPTYARQVTDRLRLGASLIAALQWIEVEGLSAFAPMSAQPDRLSNQGHDHALGIGAKFGLQLAVTDKLVLAAAGQTRIRTQPMGKYQGLLADRGRFDIPGYVTLGLAWALQPAITAVVDVQRIFYSQIPALGNPLASPGQLGDKNGPGFGWRDAIAYKVGLEITASERLTWRMGYSDNRDPVRDTEMFFTPLAGSLLGDHYTAGAHIALNEHNGLDLAATYCPIRSRSGENPLFPDQRIEAELGGLIVDVVWTRRF